MVFNRCHAAMMKAIYNVDVEQGECILNYLSGPGDREAAKMDFDRAMKGETFIRDSYAGDEKFNRRYFAIHHKPILNLGIIDSGEPYCAEYRIITRSGNIRWIEHKCQAVYDDGKWMGRRSSNRDGTERKELAIERERFIHELRTALDEVQTLRGFLPTCAYCKKIRNDEGYWDQIESYISKHSQAVFFHRICPECSENIILSD